MAEDRPPWVIEASELIQDIDDDNTVVIDVSRSHVYSRNHIPGAVHLDYTSIVASRTPVMGLLPDAEKLGQALGKVGITPDSYVVAYDDEGGGKASRLIWTLAAIGHSHCSLLNGGLRAWLNSGETDSQQAETASVAAYPVIYQSDCVADMSYVLEHLNDPLVTIVDARSADEYCGKDKRARRGGHIPGAVNVEWSRTLDHHNSLRLKERDELLSLYLPKDVVPDKEIITYCHSHRRSAHTFIVLKHLGYPCVRGYPGSWSDWGNSEQTPIE